MQWLKHNGLMLSLMMLFLYSVFAITVAWMTPQPMSTIEVKEGDTLWTLAEQYKGKMARDEWIATVKRHNQLSRDLLFVGDQLDVPDASTTDEKIRVATNK